MPGILELQETAAVPEPTTLPGVIAPQTKPDGTVSVRATVPLKPFRLVTVTVAVPVEPALAWREVTDVMLKS